MPLPNQDATQIVTNQGLRTQYGVIIPPGAKVAAFVRSTGAGDDSADSFLIANLVTTLAAGIARCRPGKGDFVVVLPGHVENVADATSFSAALPSGGGVNIVGVGHGALAPTFTWTAVASSWAVNQPNITISGLKMLWDGISNVTTPIVVTQPDFGLYYNDIEISTTARSVNIGMTITSSAARAEVIGNTFRGLASVVPANGLILVQAALDGVKITDNEFICPGHSTNGQVGVTAAATNIKILRNVMTNTAAASVMSITLGNFAISGHIADNRIGVLSTGAITAFVTGITIGASVVAAFNQNYVTNDVRASGILTPAADT